MTAFSESIPGRIVLPGEREVGKPITATWKPTNPDWVTLGFDDRVTEVSRDGWRAGTEAPHCEAGGRIYPAQGTNAHWTVLESRVPGLPVLQWWVWTWRVMDFIVSTHQPVPTSWAADFEDLADDAAFDSWRRNLARAA